MEQPICKWKLAVAGALAGFANGFFGAGGGLFLVPLLIGWIGLEERKAFATSVAVMLPLSILSVVVYFTDNRLDLTQIWPYLAGGAVGGFFSGRILKNMNLIWLRRAFGLLVLYGGFRALFL